MAGHSKWANIKFRKSMQDAKRGKVFTKLIREITISSRLQGPDASTNPRLRAAVAKALSQNMTRDTIERAVKKGSGDSNSNALEEIRYEGYGPGGGAVIVDCMTDNRKRTVSEVRHLFNKMGGNLGVDGSVAYLFRQRGQILIAPGQTQSDKVLELVLDAGAEDLLIDKDESMEVVTSVEDFVAVEAALTGANIAMEKAEIEYLPEIEISLDSKHMETFIKLLDGLEDLDDVQSVYTNVIVEYPS